MPFGYLSEGGNLRIATTPTSSSVLGRKSSALPNGSSGICVLTYFTQERKTASESSTEAVCCNLGVGVLYSTALVDASTTGVNDPIKIKVKIQCLIRVLSEFQCGCHKGVKKKDELSFLVGTFILPYTKTATMGGPCKFGLTRKTPLVYLIGLWCQHSRVLDCSFQSPRSLFQSLRLVLALHLHDARLPSCVNV